MKKIIAIISLVVVLICACGCRQAYRVDYNTTREAENFNIYRRVTVINCIKGDTLFSMEGWMNIEADTTDNQLEVIVNTDKGIFKKHFIGLSDNVTYTVEDISGEDVSPYHYELHYNPNMWIPFSVVVDEQ